MEPGSNSLTITQTKERHSLRCAFFFISLCSCFCTPTVISSNETRFAQSEVDINNFFCAFSSEQRINTLKPARQKSSYFCICGRCSYGYVISHCGNTSASASCNLNLTHLCCCFEFHTSCRCTDATYLPTSPAFIGVC